MGKIKRIIGAFIHAPERFDELAGRIADVNEERAALNRRVDGMMADIEDDIDRAKIRMDGMEGRVGEMNISWFMDQLCDDPALLSRLNRGLSIAPTVWGDRERLEIDRTAAVFTCFFNTNSGRIRVGESTFAGSGVSLLAGSHDPQLTGFLRRDMAITEGCDIDIGKGVWLASGCTVLGPCEIGDNAVIAAGAVVIPGTKVPANTIWGGVPARQIGTIEGGMMKPENPAVCRAFERSEGILFTDGWGERISGVFETPGHWMYKQAAGLITDRAEWRLEYRREETAESRIRVSGPAGESEIVLTASEGGMTVYLPVKEGELGEVILRKDTEGSIFMAWSQPTTEAVPDAAEEKTAEEPYEAPTCPEDGRLDIAKIIEEIRAEARKWASCEDLPAFGSMPKEDTRKCEKLKEQIQQLTNDYVIPVQFADPSRNPLKRIYKKITTKAVHCATAPMSVKITETNLGLKTALEKAVEVIAEQEKRIAELEKRME